MKKYNHNKLKNTGILFELLIRQITSDILNHKDKTFAENVIKKHFHGNSELLKELHLFQTLLYDKFNKVKLSEDLINIVLNKRKQLNESKLKFEKYNLIKDLKESIDIKSFMKSKINNYTVISAIQTLFDDVVNKEVPSSLIVKSKYSILEHIQQSKQDKIFLPEHIEQFKKLPKHLQLLSMKILMDKFNKKYATLNESQKTLLGKYVTSVSNNTELKQYIKTEIEKTQNQLLEHKNKIDERLQIKLEKVIDKLQTFKSGNTSKDEDIEVLLRSYSLLESLNDMKQVVKTKKVL